MSENKHRGVTGRPADEDVEAVREQPMNLDLDYLRLRATAALDERNYPGVGLVKVLAADVLSLIEVIEGDSP